MEKSGRSEFESGYRQRRSGGIWGLKEKTETGPHLRMEESVIRRY